MNNGPLKILVVDDSALYRQSIENVLRELPDVSVVGRAKNGLEALDQIERLDPDLLTLDVQMPEMDGIELLRELKRRRLRPKAIMVSSLTATGAQVTTEALMEGAFDFLLKPSGSEGDSNRQQLKDSLDHKIAAFRQSRHCDRPAVGSPPQSEQERESDDVLATVPSPGAVCELVVIGTSTGGPAALKTVCPKFPESVTVPIIVVQHMPSTFTRSLAARLDLICPLEVSEARDGDEAKGGQIILAPGGRQTYLQRRDGAFRIRVTDDPPENGIRPSIDYFLRKSNRAVGSGALAVIMTGMGRDGLEGCRLLKDSGGFVFAQSQRDCVVYGMPKAVIEHGLADRVLPLGKIAPAVVRHIKRSNR